MTRKQKAFAITKLAELVTILLQDGKLADGNDLRDAVGLIKDVDSHFARSNNGKDLQKMSDHHKKLAELNSIKL